ncbi:hypothetical protein ACG7TL_007422 [Trametes sanguinea]
MDPIIRIGHSSPGSRGKGIKFIDIRPPSLLPRSRSNMQVGIPPVSAPTVIEPSVNTVFRARNVFRKSPKDGRKYGSTELTNSAFATRVGYSSRRPPSG